jgi:mono/diheme cytochrome c family protein
MNRAGITIIAAAALALSTISIAAQAPAGRGAGRGAAAPRVGTPPTSPVTGNATSGKKLYFDYACYSCHGYNGETGARTFVPNWPANLATESSFMAFLRGRANLAPAQPSTSMPNYSAQTLTDAQVKDLYAYIRTFKSNAPPTDQIGTFKQILAAAQKPYKP